MKAVLLATALVFASGFLAYRYHNEVRTSGVADSPLTLIKQCLSLQQQEFDWPPRLNEPYPDLHLIDQLGSYTRLSDFKGKIILIEPIGMPCKACQAFCGGHERGGFQGIPPQSGLPSMHELAQTYGGFDLSDPRLVKVHLLLYNLELQAPTRDDAHAWSTHFGMDRAHNEIVLAGLPSMVGPDSYALIPGLQLVDEDFVLRVDSTGRSRQQHDLYRELLPRVGAMLEDESP